MSSEFYIQFSKDNKMPNFMQICPEGPELFHAYRETDFTKLTVAFRSSAKAPKRTSATLQASELYHSQK
jgi:hypothetical protein